jgi:prepilin-type processing-associated H-X9-DG protein
MNDWLPTSNDSPEFDNEDDSSLFDFPKRMASISAKSKNDLGLFGAGVLYRVMLFQWGQSAQSVKAQSSQGARFVIKNAPTLPGRPLVLTSERGGWGVDLVETFALWNNLEGVAKAEAIYKITGAILKDSPRSEPLNRELCQSNLKQIGLAMRQYIQDYDDKYPIAKPWISALRPYAGSQEVFHCPTLPSQSYGYAYNSKLSNKAERSLDVFKIVGVYETTLLKRNAYGTGENLAFRHLNGANYAFADGHVKWFAKGQTPSFKLKP